MIICVIVLDLDGILFISKKIILFVLLEVLVCVREVGYQVIVVIGCYYVVIYFFYQVLVFDIFVICCNGIYLYDYYVKKVLVVDFMLVE